MKIINHSGCCPSVELVCKPELCPVAQECPKYYDLKNSTLPGKCCPEYRCEAPKNKCIYNPEYTADEAGGERLRNQYEKQQVLKKVSGDFCHRSSVVYNQFWENSDQSYKSLNASFDVIHFTLGQ